MHGAKNVDLSAILLRRMVISLYTSAVVLVFIISVYAVYPHPAPHGNSSRSTLQRGMRWNISHGAVPRDIRGNSNRTIISRGTPNTRGGSAPMIRVNLGSSHYPSGSGNTGVNASSQNTALKGIPSEPRKPLIRVNLGASGKSPKTDTAGAGRFEREKFASGRSCPYEAQRMGPQCSFDPVKGAQCCEKGLVCCESYCCPSNSSCSRGLCSMRTDTGLRAVHGRRPLPQLKRASISVPTAASDMRNSQVGRDTFGKAPEDSPAAQPS